MKSAAVNVLSAVWRALRAISHDDAYERYAEHLRRHHPGQVPVDRRAFYLAEQQRRFDGGPTSCC